jgi:hypothetical protein
VETFPVQKFKLVGIEDETVRLSGQNQVGDRKHSQQETEPGLVDQVVFAISEFRGSQPPSFVLFF